VFAADFYLLTCTKIFGKGTQTKTVICFSKSPIPIIWAHPAAKILWKYNCGRSGFPLQGAPCQNRYAKQRCGLPLVAAPPQAPQVFARHGFSLQPLVQNRAQKKFDSSLQMKLLQVNVSKRIL
jgi:hypothetical protein